MSYTSKEHLFGLRGKRRYKDVVIGDPFGEEPLRFRIRSITEAEWSEISAGNFDMRRGGLNAAGIKLSDALLVVVSLVDKDGNVLLTGDPKSNARQIAELDTAITQPLVRECRDWSQLRSAEAEGSEKNSLEGNGWATNLPESQETQHEPASTT